MGFAEDKMWEYVKDNITDFNTVTLEDMFIHLTGCIQQSDMDELRATLRNKGNERTVYHFFDAIRRRSGWVTKLIRALRVLSYPELAERLQSRYDALQIPKCSQRSINSDTSSVAVPACPQPAPSHGTETLVVDVSVLQSPRTFKNAPPSQPPTETGIFSPGHLPHNQPQPSQPEISSATATGSSASSFQTRSYEDFEEVRTPITETQPAVGVTRNSSNNNLTPPPENVRPGFAYGVSPSSTPRFSDLGEAVPCPQQLPSQSSSSCLQPPNLPPQNPRKEGFQSRLSQEESTSNSIVEPALGAPGRLPFIPAPEFNVPEANPDPAVRRKDNVLHTEELQHEISDHHIKKQPSPNAGVPSNKNTERSVQKSHIPRKVGLATRENRPLDVIRRVLPPNSGNENVRRQDGIPAKNTAVEYRRVLESNDEEGESALSKPGMLTSHRNGQDWNPGIRPLSGVDEDGTRSSMHSSHLAIDPSTDATTGGTASVSQLPVAGESRRGNVQVLVNQQKPDLNGEDSVCSSYTVRSDPLMISPDSLPYVGKEPEEDEYAYEREGRWDSSRECGHTFSRDDLSERNANPDDRYNDGNSLYDTRNYQLDYITNPSIVNFDANTVRPSTTSQSDGTNSQRNHDDDDDETRKKEVAFFYILLPSILFGLVGIFLFYKSRQKP